MKKIPSKENESKLKDTIQKLRAERRRLLKKIKFLEDELININKPVRERLKDEPVKSESEFRADFAKRFKESLEK